MTRIFRLVRIIALLSVLSVQTALAQQPEASSSGSDPTTVFLHPDSSRFWLSGQMNVIFQSHPSFHAAYSGENSLRATSEHATSTLLTLFTGVMLGARTEVLFDVESAGGRGLSDALGLAGFTDLDVVRNPSLGAAPYLARLMAHHTIPLGSERMAGERTPLALAGRVPVRRIDVRVGKFGTADFFDLNAVGSDSHLQFTNWTVDNNGAYDYAADTRGYTWGAIVEYHDRAWAIRFGEMLMPKVANGIELDWNMGRARGENLEVELHPALIPAHSTTLRLLSYANHANMGDYRTAVQQFESGAGKIPVPVIEETRQQGRVKYGFGVNGEQEVTPPLRLFWRWGWNEPHFESFAYTEANSTAAFGGDHSGGPWKRTHDKIGAAFVTNGISGDHQTYLRLGGKGFLLGDGGLSYGRERIVEVYYTAHLWRGAFASGQFQRIANPGYNSDRGPVDVFGLRLHVDF